MLTSTTSPDTGAYSSDTALTDSIVPNDCPCFSVAPDLGQLDVDDVAELLLRVVGDADLAAVAGELDPLVVFRVFEAGRIRIAIHLLGPANAFGRFVERHRDDARARAAAADVDVEFGAGRRVLDRQVRHADRFLQERRLRAARDDAGLSPPT